MSDKEDDSEVDLPPLPNSSDLFLQHLERALQNDQTNESESNDGGGIPKSLFGRLIQRSFGPRKESFDEYIRNPENPCPLSYNEVVQLIKREKHPVVMSLVLQVVLSFLETKPYDSEYQQIITVIFGSFKSLRRVDHLIPIFFFFVEKSNPAGVIDRTVRIYKKEKNKKLKIFIITFWKQVLEEYGIRVYSNTLGDIIDVCQRDYKVMFLRGDLKSYILTLHRFCTLKVGKKIESKFPELKEDFDAQASQPVAKGKREFMNLSISAIAKKKKKKRKKKRKKSSLKKKPFSGLKKKRRVAKKPLRRNVGSSLNTGKSIPPPPPPPARKVVKIGEFKKSEEGMGETSKPLKIEDIPLGFFSSLNKDESVEPLNSTTNDDILPSLLSKSSSSSSSSSSSLFTPINLVTTKKASPILSNIEVGLRDSKTWKEKVECIGKLEEFLRQKKGEMDSSTLSRIQKVSVSTFDECKVVASQLACLRCLSLIPWQSEGSTPQLVTLLNRYREKNKRVVESLTKTLHGLNIRVTHKLFKSLSGKVSWKDSPDVLFHFLKFVEPKIGGVKKLAHEVLAFIKRKQIGNHPEARIREISSNMTREIESKFPPLLKRESFVKFGTKEQMKESANRLSQRIDRKKSLESKRFSSASSVRKSLGLSQGGGLGRRKSSVISKSSERERISDWDPVERDDSILLQDVDKKGMKISGSSVSSTLSSTSSTFVVAKKRKSRVRFSIPLEDDDEEEEEEEKKNVVSEGGSQGIEPTVKLELKDRRKPKVVKRPSILKTSSAKKSYKKKLSGVILPPPPVIKKETTTATIHESQSSSTTSSLPVVVKKERESPIRFQLSPSEKERRQQQRSGNTFEMLQQHKVLFLERCLNLDFKSLSSFLLPYFGSVESGVNDHEKAVVFKDFCFLINEMELGQLFSKMSKCLTMLKKESLLKDYSELNVIIQKVAIQSSPTKCLSSLLGLLEEGMGKGVEGGNEVSSDESSRVIYTILILKIVREYKKKEERRRSTLASSSINQQQTTKTLTTTCLDVRLILKKLNLLLMIDINMKREKNRNNADGYIDTDTSLYIMRIIKTVITQFVKVLGHEIYDHVYTTTDRSLGIMQCIDIVFQEVYGQQEEEEEEVGVEQESSQEQLKQQREKRKMNNDFEDLRSLENLKRIHQDFRQKHGDVLDMENGNKNKEELFDNLKKKFDGIYKRWTDQ